MPHRFKLRFSPQYIKTTSDRYSYPNEDYIVDTLGPEFRKLGYLDKKAFLKLCYWKTPRTQKRCTDNSDELIRATTGIALSTPCEELRIKILLVLNGVSWPTASVILHFGYNNLYPILDYRALWSVGIKMPPSYKFELWEAYTKFCREQAHRHGVSMRIFDRALWQYSKENQP